MHLCGVAAYAAARAYDRALVTKRHPSELSHSLNFPVQDYTAAESSSVSTAAAAAVKELHKLHAKPSGKKLGGSPNQPPHLYPSSSRHRSAASGRADPRHHAGLAFGDRKDMQPPAKRSRSGQTAAEHSPQQRPISAGPVSKADADQINQHHKPSKPHTPKHAAVDAPKAQPDGNVAMHGVDWAQDPELEPGQHGGAQVPDSKPHSSRAQPSNGRKLPEATIAIDAQHMDASLQQQAEPASDGVAPGTAVKAAASAPRSAGTVDNAERQDMHLAGTATRPDQSEPRLDSVICHAPKNPKQSEPQTDSIPSVPPHAQPTDLQSMTQHDTASEQHQAEPGPRGKVNRGADPTFLSPTQPPADSPPTAAQADSHRAGATPIAGPLPSTTPETVRAGDSDDDVEIMDDSPVRRSEPLSPASSSLQAMHTGTADPIQQQPGPEADESVPPWEQAEESLPPWAQTQEQHMPQQRLPKQLPEQQLPEQQIPEQHLPEQQFPEQQLPEQRVPEQQLPEQDLLPEKQQQSRSVQQHKQHGQSLGQQHGQSQWQAQKQHPVEQQQSSWQPQPHQQHNEIGLDSAGLSAVHANLSKLSDFVDIVLTAAGRPPGAAHGSKTVKQEPAPSPSPARDPTPMPYNGVKAHEAVAGSSSTHPVELSESDGGKESDGDSSTSSSVDPSQLVPAPWLHADTAASKQQGGALPGLSRVTAARQGRTSPALGRVTARLAGRVLHRQPSQGSTLSNGHLRTKRCAASTVCCMRLLSCAACIFGCNCCMCALIHVACMHSMLCGVAYAACVFCIPFKAVVASAFPKAQPCSVAVLLLDSEKSFCADHHSTSMSPKVPLGSYVLAAIMKHKGSASMQSEADRSNLNQTLFHKQALVKASYSLHS